MDGSAARARRMARMRQRRTPAAIGICASTGGPMALQLLLGELPASFPIPVLVVQHVGDVAQSKRLAEWLDSTVDIPVRLAEDGARLERGVWLGPAGSHVRLGHWGRLELAPPRTRCWHCPSGDVLLGSLADALGPDAAAVVLTGIGSDGAEGLRRVLVRGGLTIAQDEASSVVFGMPKVAVENGAELVLDPSSIGAHLSSLAPAERRKVVMLPHPAEGARMLPAFR